MAVKNLIDCVDDSTSSLVRMEEATYANVPTLSDFPSVMGDNRDYL